MTYIIAELWPQAKALIYKVRQYNYRNGPVKEKFAAVAFETLSLWNCELREMIMPLPETVFKIVFHNTSQ
jgi:hypothetical protein